MNTEDRLKHNLVVTGPVAGLAYFLGIASVEDNLGLAIVRSLLFLGGWSMSLVAIYIIGGLLSDD
jgi:hypothetical protein